MYLLILLARRRVFPKPADIPDLVRPLVETSSRKQLLKQTKQHHHDPDHQRPGHGAFHPLSRGFRMHYDGSRHRFLVDFPRSRAHGKRWFRIEDFGGDLEPRGEAVFVETIVCPSSGEGHSTCILDRRKLGLCFDALENQ